MKSILEKTRNTRELGGYLISAGVQVPYSGFWRSDQPVALSDADIACLLQNNMTTIIDLRSDQEIEEAPHSLENHSEFHYHHLKMYGGGRIPNLPEEVALSYFEMVDDGKQNMKEILRTMASASTGIVFNCAEGKDRTGVLSAVLLTLAGVHERDITENYYITKENLQPLLDEWAKMPSRKYSMEVVTPHKQYMMAFLEMFRKKYGSAEAYMLEIGLTEKEINSLKEKLTMQG